MPFSYPPGTPTISGDLVTISRFLQSPTQIRRRLRDYRDLRFVSDQVLTGRYNTSGGAALYEQSEPFITDRTATIAVSPGAEYPMANMATGTAALAAVSKWGQKVPLTDEAITRSVYGQQEVDRALRKVVNTIISQVDSVTTSAVTSAVTQKSTVTVSWSTGTPTILKDILLARKVITDLKMGYNPDVVVMDDARYTYLMTDATITNAIQRETRTSPVYTGEFEVIAGLAILHSPNWGINPLVFDSNQLGGMADEQAGAPGYALSDLAVQVKSIRKDEIDGWHLQGRRLTVPIVQETGSGCFVMST